MPIDGSSFLLELPYCDTNCFQLFLNEMLLINPDEFKIIVLNNGTFHKGQAVEIPENTALLFLPPYSPELNPAEKMWAKFKRKFSNLFCKTLDDVSTFIQDVVENPSAECIINTCNY